MNFFKRLTSDTPKFFKKIRNWSLAAVSIGGILVAAPLGIPALILAGHFLVAGGGIGAIISQTVVTPEAMEAHKTEEYLKGKKEDSINPQP